MSPRGDKLNEHMRAEAMTKITGAALKVFAEYGYHGATMGQIMKASKLSKGLFYHYFPSKERLFFHLVDTALGISGRIWSASLDAPGTAWEKIERLSDSLVKNAFSEESSLYSLIMVQALTQGKGIPGLFKRIMQHLSVFGALTTVIIQAQKDGDAAQGDPEVLASTYLALFQGYALVLINDDELKRKITPDVFTGVLRNTGKTRRSGK